MQTHRGAFEGYIVALDGGTTNTRGRLIQGRQIVATARRSIGVRDNLPRERSGSPESGPNRLPAPKSERPSLVRSIREILDELLQPMSGTAIRESEQHPLRPEYIVAAGMLSSEVGIATVPHLDAPAGPEEAARSVHVLCIPAISESPIHFIPGVRTPAGDGPDGWFTADVMRGEECETWGAYFTLSQSGEIKPKDRPAFLWPGSHTKLVEVDEAGRILRTHTSLAGELLQAVAKHTVVAASLPGALPDEVDQDAVKAGGRAVARDGLERAAFLVRIAALTQTLNACERASFWIGAVVESDIQCLARHPILAPGRPVWIGGREPLRSLYAIRLAQRHQGPVAPLSVALAESASAFGALEVLLRRFAP
jgi:2-dehydro-3-deoxygalactonokinase